MNASLRQYFDQQLKHVLAELPPPVRALLDEVPLVVEDYPSRELMREMEIEHRDELCGLYTGIPLIEKSVHHSGVPSDVILLYRRGILSQARDDDDQIDEAELRRQIRLTVLHEFGHYHGMTEEELDELGYG
jgi:predicted Zn-dependent protease with MMP-like domain